MNPAVELPPWAALATAALLFMGAAITLIGALGLLRLKSFYERVHGPTLGTTLGAGFIVLASMIYFSVLQTRPVLHEILIMVFITVTTPVTLIILVLMSMGSWYILITKLYESLRLSSQAKTAQRTFFKSKSLRDGAAALKEGSAFRFIADSGIQASEHHEGALTENIDHNSWVSMSVQRSIDDIQSRLQDGLAFLATVGSTAPFVGLFGTVWGIYHALTAIGIAGQASIDKVAGPVGEALIMTAIGLAVAVPAVLGYNWLVRRNKVTMEAVRRFGADLHGVLMGARPVAASVAAQR